jgi:hypothetical protein
MENLNKYNMDNINNLDKLEKKIDKLSKNKKKNYYELLNIYKDLIVLYYSDNV